MTFSRIQAFIRGIITQVPWWHWVIIGILAFAAGFLIRKKTSAYGAFALGISALVGLLLLDTAVLIRYCGFLHHASSGIDLGAEYARLVHAGQDRRIELFSNMVVFTPIGFFMSEFLASMKRFSAWKRIGLAILFGLGVSLSIECLQLVLRVGYFELTDLVLNTVGAGIGAALSVLMEQILGYARRKLPH